MAGVSKYSIATLNASLTNIVVVGVIIAKQQLRHFENKQCKYICPQLDGNYQYITIYIFFIMLRPQW